MCFVDIIMTSKLLVIVFRKSVNISETLSGGHLDATTAYKVLWNTNVACILHILSPPWRRDLLEDALVEHSY